MAVINHAKREINAKLVYFGPPNSGKGDLFRYIHQRIKPTLCGPLKTMSAGADTLLFFDYIPFDTSSLNGYRIRFHLYTLTGPVANPGTWKMTLKGVDGLVFVTAETTIGRAAAEEGLRMLRAMLSGYGKELHNLPRLWLSAADMRAVSRELDDCFDAEHTVVSSASSGSGVLQALAQLSQEVLQHLREEFDPEPERESEMAVVENDSVGAAMTPATDSLHSVGGTTVLPELRLSLEGTGQVQLPLVVHHEGRTRRYNLNIALSLEEGSV